MELQLFSTQDGRNLEWIAFQNHPLGQLRSTIPLQELAQQFPPPKYTQSGLGRRPWLDVSGGICLLVLKHRYKLSDEKLLEQLNDNRMMQLFCGIRLGVGQRIRDKDLVSRWRRYLGQHLDLNGLQKKLGAHWKANLDAPHKGMSDATCYESGIRYPTDVKLLWECCDYLYKELIKINHSIGRSIRSAFRFTRQRKRYLAYQRRRRKTHKKEKRLRANLLRFLDKLRKEVPRTIAAYQAHSGLLKIGIPTLFWIRQPIIKQIYQQQYWYYHEPASKIPNRIVSLARPYIRPIVRGKQNKRVEFGMKVNMLQVDGIDFIEHWDFNAFHEGIRLPQTLACQQNYLKVKVLQFGADAIYATNANRKLCKSLKITTSFLPKGRKAKDEAQRQQMRKLLRKERSTRLEGSFGSQKNHYLLGRIEARTKHTEFAWVFFGILTANMHRLVKRMNAPPKPA